MLTTLFFVGFLMFLYIFFINKNKNYWRKRNIVQVNRNAWHFLFGKCSLSEIYKELYDTYPSEKYIGTFVGLKPALVLRSLEDIQAVLQSDFQSFYGRGYKTNPKDELADNLLLIDEYCRWKLIRRKITPVFTSLKLKNMFGDLERCASDFVSFIENRRQSCEEVFEALHTFTSATICASVFGLCGTTENAMLSPLLDKGWKRINSSIIFNLSFALSNISPTLHRFLNLKVFSQHKDFFISIFKDVMNNRRSVKDKRHDFIDACLEIQSQGKINDSSTGYELNSSDELLAAQAFSFFIAGVDTVANSLNFILLELSNNAGILNKLHMEIDKIFDENEDKITYEDIKKMQYLDMVISEALRKYPPIGLMQRMCTNDTKLPGGLKVEKDSIVVIPIFGLHRDNNYFPDPETFDPERFNPENMAKLVKFSYLPFGEGNRICIGEKYTHLQMKTCIAHLLRRYTLKGQNYRSLRFEPSFFTMRDSKARYDLIARKYA